MAVIKRLCVYCGSSTGVDPGYREAAARLGTLLAESGVELVYGGGRVGLMGTLADAALAAGGRVTGIVPRHLHDREVAHRGIQNLIVVASMHERKQRMFELADAFAVLPGGLGTLDETIEMLTWRQLGLHGKPVIVVDIAGYWAPLIDLFEHAIAHGFAAASSREYYRVVARIDDLLPALAALPQPPARVQSELA
ncbi:MAG TPA: TIGR00730 family Rossman fold protein [Stellaceae bacterium]|nr:TIGR00730 family Rossman fold protein [Stellaceae bacterium]